MKNLFKCLFLFVLCVVTAQEVRAWEFDESTGVLRVKSNYNYSKFPYYPWSSFADNIKSVEFTSSVTSIGRLAFEGCSSLTSVTIPSSVTSIGDDAFQDCSSLKRVDITDLIAWCRINFGNADSNPLTYAQHLYFNGQEFINLYLPEGVTSIGDYAFRGCSSLRSVTIPSSVTSIGDDAFAGCSSLLSVTILEGVTSIGSCAFYDCSSLKSITIPSSVTSIGDFAFYCSDLTSVTIPKGVTSIGEYAFQNCI